MVLMGGRQCQGKNGDLITFANYAADYLQARCAVPALCWGGPGAQDRRSRPAGCRYQARPRLWRAPSRAALHIHPGAACWPAERLQGLLCDLWWLALTCHRPAPPARTAPRRSYKFPYTVGLQSRQRIQLACADAAAPMVVIDGNNAGAQGRDACLMHDAGATTLSCSSSTSTSILKWRDGCDAAWAGCAAALTSSPAAQACRAFLLKEQSLRVAAAVPALRAQLAPLLEPVANASRALRKIAADGGLPAAAFGFFAISDRTQYLPYNDCAVRWHGVEGGQGGALAWGGGWTGRAGQPPSPAACSTATTARCRGEEVGWGVGRGAARGGAWHLRRAHGGHISSAAPLAPPASKTARPVQPACAETRAGFLGHPPTHRRCCATTSSPPRAHPSSLGPPCPCPGWEPAGSRPWVTWQTAAAAPPPPSTCPTPATAAAGCAAPAPRPGWAAPPGRAPRAAAAPVSCGGVQRRPCAVGEAGSGPRRVAIANWRVSAPLPPRLPAGPRGQFLAVAGSPRAATLASGFHRKSYDTCRPCSAPRPIGYGPACLECDAAVCTRCRCAGQRAWGAAGGWRRWPARLRCSATALRATTAWLPDSRLPPLRPYHHLPPLLCRSGTTWDIHTYTCKLGCQVQHCAACQPSNPWRCATCQAGHHLAARGTRCAPDCAVPNCAACVPGRSSACAVCAAGYRKAAYGARCQRCWWSYRGRC